MEIKAWKTWNIEERNMSYYIISLCTNQDYIKGYVGTKSQFGSIEE